MCKTDSVISELSTRIAKLNKIYRATTIRDYDIFNSAYSNKVFWNYRVEQREKIKRLALEIVNVGSIDTKDVYEYSIRRFYHTEECWMLLDDYESLLSKLKKIHTFASEKSYIYSIKQIVDDIANNEYTLNDLVSIDIHGSSSLHSLSKANVDLLALAPFVDKFTDTSKENEDHFLFRKTLTLLKKLRM